MAENNLSIKTVNLKKTFNNLTAVKNINLEINPGEIFAFLGPNGAGKTTTVKLLCGLLKPTSGEIYVCGQKAEKNSIEIKKLIGLVPDHPFIYPKLKGVEFLQLIGDVYNVSLNEQKDRIPELLKTFGLEEASLDLIETYSLGMRQKLVICSVLLHKPKILILDEPLVGLDPKSARLVKDIFHGLAQRGTTVFMCTHILEIAEKLATKIGIIHKGELIALGTKEEICAKTTNTGTLEDIYLELTGGFEYSEVLKFL
ncbi:MAG: ABC transporter [Elusimicrobia bacterium RIFOXYA2_FULL_40_6]|nr:MAG: ABC transporter [Elusimicrobia bacterium RIFOXYA2_FULL_40_6]